MYRAVTAQLHDPGLLDTPTLARACDDSYVPVLPVVLIIAAVAILGGVIVVAMGRGGELAPSDADVRPLDADIVTAADVALLRPPAALWGYDMRATDEALNRVARTVTERDVEIADLRRQLADMQSAGPDPRDTAWDMRNPRHAAGPPDTARYEIPVQDPRGVASDGGAPGAVAPGAVAPGAVAPGPVAPESGVRPPALPFQRAVGGPTRPPGGERSWSAWQRPGRDAGQDRGQERAQDRGGDRGQERAQDPGDYPEAGTASGRRG
jgi:hypothetical protein